ncbi:hypothetical protein [Lentzea aerocolonigenes]|uniref:hypothetical protein n=1 Tax=Lentzea aerocolonigenes TaxID=68170 RepID=UPI000697B815|nr:hypothetical protein [Lentzea aerocolonigenes]
MIEMRAVLEVTGGYLELSGRMTRHEVGAALVAIAEYGEDEDFSPEMLRALLDEEMILMAGGLEVRDTGSGAEIKPGCCAGLESWRNWGELLGGKAPWLGHSPEPGVEFAADVVRLSQDAERPESLACEIPVADLPRLLEGVRQDLLGFLDLVRRWAPDGLGERLAARFDEHFHISAPL